MPHFHKTLAAYAKLLSYPQEAYVQSAEMLYVVLQGESEEAARCVAQFAKHVEPLTLHQLEEAYATTFDVNPTCALEIGWHLFGEEYARGTLLVRLRGEMRDRGIEESVELPDHLVHVLAIIASMTHDEAQQFVHACVLAALDKMLTALDKADNPYANLIRSLILVLEGRFGRPEKTAETEEDTLSRLASMPQGDPLQNYPMPGSLPSSPDEVVPLRMNFHETPNECGHSCQGGSCNKEEAPPISALEIHRTGEGNV